MDKTGDTKIIWDPGNDVEVRNAERTFNDLRDEGYAAFRVNKQGETDGEQIDEFDKNAEKLIMVPPLAGG